MRTEYNERYTRTNGTYRKEGLIGNRHFKCHAEDNYNLGMRYLLTQSNFANLTRLIFPANVCTDVDSNYQLSPQDKDNNWLMVELCLGERGL